MGESLEHTASASCWEPSAGEGYFLPANRFLPSWISIQTFHPEPNWLLSWLDKAVVAWAWWSDTKVTQLLGMYVKVGETLVSDTRLPSTWFHEQVWGKSYHSWKNQTSNLLKSNLRVFGHYKGPQNPSETWHSEETRVKLENPGSSFSENGPITSNHIKPHRPILWSEPNKPFMLHPWKGALCWLCWARLDTCNCSQEARGPWMQSARGRSSRGCRKWCRSSLSPSNSWARMLVRTFVRADQVSCVRLVSNTYHVDWAWRVQVWTLFPNLFGWSINVY